MGSSHRESAGRRAGRTSGRAGARVPARLSRLLSLLVLALAAGLVLSASAGAAATTHVFSSEKSFIGEGACKFTEPGGVAVSDPTGEIFVFDRATNAIDRFSSSGACLTHRRIGALGTTGEPTDEGIAVNNTSGSLSFGDVYVVENEPRAILKFKPEGDKLVLAGKIKKFKVKIGEAEGKPEFEEFEEFGEIHGLAEDAKGNLWVDEGEMALVRFTPTEGEPVIREAGARVEVSGGECAPRPGFAVTAEADFFYVGRERENRKAECEGPSVAMKLNAAGEPALEPPFNAQLDLEPTVGVAVDHATGTAYFDNAASISAFSATDDFVERFGKAAGEGKLQESTGVAVNSSTNEVLAVEAHEGRVQVYVPGTPGEGTPGEPEKTHALPDHRAYEQVTPQNKFGASIYPISFNFGLVQASDDGSAIAFSATGPVVSAPPTNRAIEPSQNVARRGTTAWGTDAIGTPHGPRPGGYRTDSGTEYEFFTADLASGLVTPFFHGLIAPSESLLSPEATEATPFWRNLTVPSASCEPVPSTCYAALVSAQNFKGSGPFGQQATFASATPDGHSAILNSDVALTADPIGTRGLYEWQTGGALQLVSVLPAGETGPPESAKLGGAGEGSGGIMARALSNNGARVIWSTGTASEPSPLYVRDTTKGETLRLDKAQGGTAEPETPQAQFQSASTDGSRVFFTDTAPLLPDSTSVAGFEEEENGSLGSGDLYVCEIAETAGKLACNLTDLTAKGGGSSEAAAVQGVMGTSEDGSYVYFAADGAFGNTAGPGKCTPRETVEREEELAGTLPVRKCNLYVAHRGAGGWETPALVAGVTSEDQPDWHPVIKEGGLARVTSRVSPSGAYLAFMSDSSLTGYDNRAANPEAANKPAEEVFRYSYNAGAGLLTCSSCKASKLRPNAVLDKLATGEGKGLLVDQAQNWLGRWIAANIPGWTGRSVETAIYQSRYLSDSGRLFFNSSDNLVEADNNKKMDVYEFEGSGEGTCSSANGCVSLISTGESPQESAFLDASVGGNSVFVLTSQQLVKQDIDSGFDIYDARVCTGESPCLGTPAEPPAPCADEAGCKAGATEAPAAPPVPPSASVVGPGNRGTVQILGEKESVKPTPKPLTRAQKLKLALKKCKKIKKHKKRATCERQARKKYGPVKKAKKANAISGVRR